MAEGNQSEEQEVWRKDAKLRAEMLRVAVSHEMNGERRTADLLRRAAERLTQLALKRRAA